MKIFIAFAAFAVSSALAAPPAVQSVVSAANYQPGLTSGAWLAILGSNLSTTTRAWGTSDFTGVNLPTKLNDVQVTVNGKPAYIYFISPGQINILAPDDAATGQVPVQVTNAQGVSSAYLIGKLAAAPALFSYSQLGGRFAIGQAFPSFGLIAPPQLVGPTVTTTTAAPGQSLVLYGTGFGATTPAVPTGQLVQTPAPTSTPVTVTVGGVPAQVQFAGLVASGLYQINLTVPLVPTGDAEVVVTAGGRRSAGTIYLPVQAYGDPLGQHAPPTIGCLEGQVDYATYSVARLNYGQPDEVSIGGTKMCSTCNIKPPLYGEFAARLETAILRKQSVQACYDKSGNVFTLKATRASR